jgi:hypothetical protein
MCIRDRLKCNPSPLVQAGLNLDKWKVNSSGCTPFDHPMYLIINLAVGGTMGYFKNTPNKPWKDGHGAMSEFYRNQDKWISSWKRGLEVKDIKVWEFGSTPEL